MTQLPLLSLLIWLPVVGGLLVLFGTGDRNKAASRWLALTTSLATLLLCLPLYQGFALGTHEMQFNEFANWISFGELNINYALGIDGFALPLIVLTSFISVIVIIAGWVVIENRQSQYMAAFLIMTGLMNGVFAALDAMLFYVFWEGMLVPMFLIIGIWGGPNRVYATLKFFLYTFLGSVFMLIALIYMGLKANSFAIVDLQHLPMSLATQQWVFVAFLLAFAVKVPMWPVHTWLPDAHVEAPTGGSVVLAAIMLKMGTYGFIRFSLPIAPDASSYFADFMIILSLVAVVYIGLVALVQKDMKKLVAYSSIAHMGFVTLGFFIVFALLKTGNTMQAGVAVQGALVQMISHGFISGALFLSIGVLYDRVHSRQIGDYGGVANTMPKFAMFMVFFGMANAGLPGTSGFVGEFYVILAAFAANPWIAFFAAFTLIFGAAYTLWMVKRVMFGEIANTHVAELDDISAREYLMLAALAIAVLYFGLYPKPLTDIMEPSVQYLLQTGLQSKLGGGV